MTIISTTMFRRIMHTVAQPTIITPMGGMAGAIMGVMGITAMVIIMVAATIAIMHGIMNRMVVADMMRGRTVMPTMGIVADQKILFTPRLMRTVMPL